MIKNKRKSHDFNRGVWFAVQELIYLDEPTLAKDIARAAKIDRKEARYLQKGTEFLDDIIEPFIKNNLA